MIAMRTTWKRMLGGLMAVAMAFALAACGQQGAQQSPAAQSQEPQDQTSSAPQSPEVSQAPQETEDAQTSESASGGTLVVYFSASGNTERVANDIAGATGGDLFEITPADPYTDEDLDWTEDGSRVNAEHDDPSLQNVELTTTTPENWDLYDTVFIGYPIWWGIAAWPVSSFVAANDFSGKTVIPFCTSSSSGLGESGSLLAQAAGTGTWLEGMRFRSGVDGADVVDWVDSLDLPAAEG